MHSLPSKPWKKVEIIEQGENRYLIKILSPLRDEKQFNEIIQDDLKACLDKDSTLQKSDWENKAAILQIEDYMSFKRKLVFRGVIIEKETINPNPAKS